MVRLNSGWKKILSVLSLFVVCTGTGAAGRGSALQFSLLSGYDMFQVKEANLVAKLQGKGLYSPGSSHDDHLSAITLAGNSGK